MGRQYGISGDAGRSQCQRYAAIGHFIPAAVLSVFCQGGVSYTIYDLLCAGVSGNVSVGKGEHGEQYSGGDSRGMFLCAALISGLRSFGIRHSFGGICLSVSVETEKNPSRIDVYVTVRPDQPPGVYRLCGAGIVAFGTPCCFLSKKKESMAGSGICRIAGDLCHCQLVTDPGDSGGRQQLCQPPGRNGVFRDSLF